MDVETAKVYHLLDSIRRDQKVLDWPKKFCLGFHYTLWKNQSNLLANPVASLQFHGAVQLELSFLSWGLLKSRTEELNLQNTFLSLLKSGTSLTTLSWNKLVYYFYFPFLLGWIIFKMP